jgi:hypothetical protein
MNSISTNQWSGEAKRVSIRQVTGLTSSSCADSQLEVRRNRGVDVGRIVNRRRGATQL